MPILGTLIEIVIVAFLATILVRELKTLESEK